MKKLLIILIILLSARECFGQTKSENLFYMVNTPESFESFRKNIDQISIVAPQSYTVSKSGVLSGFVDPRVIALARTHNVRVMPLIVNPGFTAELLHEIVSNPVSRKRAIDMMLRYAKANGFDGWQFDLEGLAIADRDNYTQFFRETAEAFHKVGLQLSAAVVHSIDNGGGPGAYHKFLYENWRAGYAYKELSEIGDFLSVMTYDQHTRRTPPGPVAGIAWVEAVVKYMLKEGVAPNKLSLGIPTYSDHWFADYTEEKGGFSNAVQVGYNIVEYLLGQSGAKPVWNEMAGCNYAVWDNAGVWDYLFIEDGKSLRPKLEILKKYNLRGISTWVLGKEAPDFWPVLQSEVLRK